MKTSYKEIWGTLSKVNCSKYIIKKYNLDYISWANAWGLLMNYYPEAQYTIYENEYEANGTVTVSCSVQIGECGRTMWLPVMDYKNKSIPNPTSRDISDSKMRCLVKCVSMFGLGHSVYSGEGLPSVNDSPINAKASAPLAESLTVEEHDNLPKKLVDDYIIPSGGSKGKTYKVVYSDNITVIDKHIKYHQSLKNINPNQKEHLANLRSYKSTILAKSYENGVA